MAISSGVTRKASAGEAVELSGIAEQSAITPLTYIGHDTLDHGQDSIERRAAAIFERGEKFCCLLCAAAFGSD